MVALDLEVDPAELRVPCSADVLHRLAEQVHAGQEIHDVSGFGVAVAENGHVRGFNVWPEAPEGVPAELSAR